MSLSAALTDNQWLHWQWCDLDWLFSSNSVHHRHRGHPQRQRRQVAQQWRAHPCSPSTRQQARKWPVQKMRCCSGLRQKHSDIRWAKLRSLLCDNKFNVRWKGRRTSSRYSENSIIFFHFFLRARSLLAIFVYYLRKKKMKEKWGNLAYEEGKSRQLAKTRRKIILEKSHHVFSSALAVVSRYTAFFFC